MKFLVDHMLSIRLAQRLSARGHEAVHVRDLGLAAAPDSKLMALAKTQGRVVISADRDFGTLLAELEASQPSIIYLRGRVAREPDELAALIANNLPRLEAALAKGSIVVIEPGRMRIRRLPIE